MQQSMKKALSCLLVLVMVLSVLPGTVFASEAASHAELPTSMEGLSIAYPYNTENLKINETPVSRFDALTFESARNEVESAQMILTPSFKVDSFELTMSSMTNEKGNIIPAWAFEVYVQHYVTVTGAGNAPHYDKFETLDSWFLNKKYSDYLYHPRSGNSASDGTYPNALIPQDAAITNGVNTIAAGQNGGIWVNLNVQNAAPGTYTGTAKLTVNGTDLQIPVSVCIYDVELPEEVHSILSTGIWWDQLQAGEGYVTQELADSYYNYLISKRISPWDRWNYWYTTDGLVTQVVSLASNPKVPAYLLYYKNDGREVNRDSVVATLTGVINKNIELAQSGSNVDLFKKAYFYFACVDEPAGGSSAPTYAQVQAAMNVLDSVKTELAPMLDAYPDLKTSFLGIKNIVTGPDPTNAKNDLMYIDGCADYSGSSALTSTHDSVIYCPQYQYMQTAQQRAKYADDTEVWWYGCCHPVAPYPTFHYNNPLINSRALGFMMYEYGISGAVYSSVNYWGKYTDDGISLYDYWNGYSSGTPGDQMLVYPGSDFGVEGPIGSMRIENIRESSEDYEYLWLLEQFGGNISTYTTGLYEGTIVTGVYAGHTVDPDGDGNTDANTLYHTRRVALLSKLEELNVAANGATNIAPGQENFVRGTAFEAGVGTIVRFDEAAYAGVTFDYKLTGEGNIAVVLRSPLDVPYYGVYYFVASGEAQDYSGITTEKLSDGYIRVTMNAAMLDYTNSENNRNKVPATLNKLDILNWCTTGGYVDNVQLLTDASGIFNSETKAEDLIHMTVFENATYTTAAHNYVDNYVKAEGSCASLKVNTTSNVHLCWDLRKEDGGMLDLSNSSLGAYFYFADGKPYAEAQIYDTTWGSGRLAFVFEDVGDGWYYGKIKTNAGLSIEPAKAILLRLWFNKGTTVYIDGLKCEKLVDKNDMFAGGSQAGGSLWSTGTNMTFVNNCTETYGEDSLFAWKFSATAANANQWAQFIMLMTQAYNMDGYNLVFDAKVDGVASQKLSIRPRTGSDGSGDPCTNTVLNLTEGWNTYAVDFSATLKAASSAADLTAIQRLFLVFDFAATTGAERSVIIDNVRLVCKHTDTTTMTVDATCTQEGSVTVSCNTCGEVLSTETVAASGHNYQSAVTAPNPQTQGFTTHTCINCGDSYVDNYTDYVPEDTYMVLSADMDVNLSLDKDMYINLNGFNMTGTVITNGFKVYGIDTTTDGYTCENMGIFNCLNADGTPVVPEIHHKSSQTGAIKRYLTIETENGYTFHRIYLGISHMSLKPGVTGVGYKAIFGGDHMVKAQLDATEGFGYSLWLENNEAISRSKGRDGFVSGSQGTPLTLLLKNFDAANFGEARVYANVWLKLADGTQIASSDYSYTLKELVETINDTYLSFTQTQLDAVRNMIERNPIMQTWRVENLYQLEVIRGQAFTAGKDNYFGIQAGNWDTVSFEYKTEGAGEVVAILRGSAWGSTYYGEFRFTESGEKVDYPGITTEALEDGYIRATFDIAALQRTGCVDNLNLAPADIAWIDIFNWTTVNGYLDNIQVAEKPEEEVFRGKPFTAGKDTYFTVEAGNWDTVSFEYKTVAAGEMTAILRGSAWGSTYYGEFRFTESGEKVDYPGITTETLEDGYIRVIFDIAALNRTGCVDNLNLAPADIALIDIFGAWTTVNGYLDNIQVSENPEEEVIRGKTFAAGKDNYFSLAQAGAYSTLSFDYKLSGSGELAAIIRGSKWSTFYGDFRLTENGEKVDYAGITTEKLADGYIRVTFDIAALQRTACVDNRDKAPVDLSLIDIYQWTTVDGYIDNIQYS